MRMEASTQNELAAPTPNIVPKHTFCSLDLLFINQTGPLNSKDDQTKVRKHVMKDIGRARRQNGRKGTILPVTHQAEACHRSASKCDISVTINGAERYATVASKGLIYPGEKSNRCFETIDPPRLYPIPCRGYIPSLLKHFHERFGMSIMQVDPKSMAHRLQTVWIQQSLGDTCLFHATLYAASAHLDASKGCNSSQTTIFHQAEVARHVQRRLEKFGLEILDGTIGAVIPLAFFSYVEGNLESSKIHYGGLRNMVEARGGIDKLGFDGLLPGLVRLSSMIFAIVFDQDLASTASMGLGELPNRPPTGLISRIVEFNTINDCQYKLPRTTCNILRDVYNISLYINSAERSISSIEAIKLFRNWRSCQQMYTIGGLPSRGWRVPSCTEDKIHKCAKLAAMLFFGLVDYSINFEWPTAPQHMLLEDLKAALAETDDIMWLNSAPIAYSWVCLTGAAASDDSKMRGWFYFRQGSMSRALIVDNASLVQDVWLYFDWIRQIARNISPKLCK